jgi:hypothetical protein
LVADSVLGDQIVAYDSTATIQTDVSSGGYTSFFKTTDATDCPITSCTLYTVSSGACTTTAFSATELSMDASSPWAIKAVKNVPAGFIHDVCISCQAPDTSPNTKITKVWKFTQSALDCSTKIT